MLFQPWTDRGDGRGIEPAARCRQEQPVADAAGPDRPGRPGGNQLGEPFGPARQPDLPRQHIGGAERQHGDRSRRPGHAVRHRVERAVAAGRDDDVEIRLGLARQALGVALCRPGAAQDDRAAAPPERGDHPIEKAARRSQAYVVMGCAQKDAGSYGTLYNTQIIFGPDGRILGKHRKLIPTAGERLIHTGGDGSTLLTYDTPFGGLSGLICGENINSLARTALLMDGEVVHVASWPAFAVQGNERQTHTMDVRMRYYAFEGRIFVISSAAVWTEAMKDVLELDATARSSFIGEGGHSGILNPMGDYIAGPQDAGETILYADLDLEQVARGKITQDVTGHYQRFDVFSLTVNREPLGQAMRQPVRIAPVVAGADSSAADPKA